MVTIRKTILPNTSGIIEERVKGPGTVEEVRIRFYPGQARALQVVPYVIHKGEQREDLVTFTQGSERFFSGDDDSLSLPCVVEVDNDDYLKINFNNTSSAYEYTLSVDLIIDYYAGKNRASGVMV